MQKESGVPQTPEGMPPVMERPLFSFFLLKALLPLPSTTLGTKILPHGPLGTLKIQTAAVTM